VDESLFFNKKGVPMFEVLLILVMAIVYWLDATALPQIPIDPGLWLTLIVYIICKLIVAVVLVPLAARLTTPPPR
jgi:hypothetical protein